MIGWFKPTTNYKIFGIFLLVTTFISHHFDLIDFLFQFHTTIYLGPWILIKFWAWICFLVKRGPLGSSHIRPWPELWARWAFEAFSFVVGLNCTLLACQNRFDLIGLIRNPRLSQDLYLTRYYFLIRFKSSGGRLSLVQVFAT